MRYKAHNLFASFRYALDGVLFALRTQRNMRVHFTVGLGAFLLALFLKIGLFEIAVVSTATAGVIAAEMFNTAIENAVDLATHRRHPLAKAAKDTAAAAVLLTALNAFAVGILILLPPLLKLFR